MSCVSSCIFDLLPDNNIGHIQKHGSAVPCRHEGRGRCYHAAGIPKGIEARAVIESHPTPPREVELPRQAQLTSSPSNPTQSGALPP